MFIQRLRSTVQLLLCVLCCLGSPAMADNEFAGPVTFAVGDGVTAKAVQIDDSHIGISVLPGGATTRFEIDSEGDGGTDPHFETADYNFDGHRDLAFVTQYGMVNESYRIFLYDVAARRFVELRIPAGKNQPTGNCGGLTGVSVKAAERTLYSACRSGPIWYTDAYRFDTAGKLYLYQSSADITDEVLQTHLDGEVDTGGGPVSQLLTYSSAGKIISRQLQAYGGGKANLHVDVARLPLHDAPTETQAHRYLVKGDTARADEISGDARWIKIQYRNPGKGAIDGRVKVSDLGGAADGGQ
ncbi:hypothetical protein bAD24_III03730 [Burkholderia sp. AD24]|nr:hypothetical protein bAD24_III03730 [Burkholderia sp. AD24]